MNHKIDAIILNPHACAGKAATRWKSFLTADYAKSLRADQAPVFDGTGIHNSSILREELNKWTRQRIQEGCQNFVAAGGDGTVHLAVNTLQNCQTLQKRDQNQIRLGAIALGSSNDFHKPYLTRGRKEAGSFQCRLDFESAYPHDLGFVEFSQNQSQSGSLSVFFAINSSIGMTAEANYYFNTAGGAFKTVKRFSTPTAILWAALSEFIRYEKFPIQIHIDKETPFQTRLVNLGIVKNPHFSGDFRYDQTEPVDSGSFGIHLCGDMTRLQTLKTLQNLMRGRFTGLPLTNSWSSSTVHVNSTREFSIETDGEVNRAYSARFSVLKQGMNLCP